ncbi:MAG: hypothetical protein Q8R90_03050 [Bacteroidales bacterium]|nr:hypothetical protein [Bacteroidales bacterium]
MNIEELNASLTVEQRSVLHTLLCEVRDGLTKEIVDCNNYLHERNDYGQTHRSDDKCEIISFTRGKSVGAVIGRDRLDKVINNFTQRK